MPLVDSGHCPCSTGAVGVDARGGADHAAAVSFSAVDQCMLLSVAGNREFTEACQTVSFTEHGGYSSAGRASRCGREGRGFKSRYSPK